MILTTNDKGLQVQLEGPEDRRMIEAAAAAYGAEKARQDALSKAYKVKQLTGPNGRLGVCESTVYAAISDGRLRATPTGKKGYIITEQACREFLGDKIAA